MHSMSGKLDRAQSTAVCCSERSAASDYREIESAGTAPAKPPSNREAASSADADMEKLPESFTFMYVTDYN